MWPVRTRGEPPSGKRRKIVFSVKRVDVAGRQPNRYFNGDGHGIVGEHEALERLVPHAIVSNRGDDEPGSAGREVLFFSTTIR